MPSTRALARCDKKKVSGSISLRGRARPSIYIPALHMANRVAMMHSPAGAASMLHCYTTCSKPHHPSVHLSLISSLLFRWASPSVSPPVTAYADWAPLACTRSIDGLQSRAPTMIHASRRMWSCGAARGLQRFAQPHLSCYMRPTYGGCWRSHLERCPDKIKGPAIRPGSADNV